MNKSLGYNNGMTMCSFISVFYRHQAAFLTSRFAKFSIGYGQIQFLMHLYQKDGISYDKLTKDTYMDKASTSRAINKLFENGYVDIIQDKNDKRCYNIFLTDKALLIKDEAHAIIFEWEEVMLGKLSDEQRQTYMELSTKMAGFNQLI